MAELLFEILSEEIPARMQEKAGADLGRMITDALKKAGLTVDNAAVYSGPRRLVFTADVPVKSPDVSEERKGPRTSAPEQALAGFMRGAGISDISQAEIRSDKKGEYYVALLEKQGRAASEIMAEVFPEIMGKFPWPKSMKSGTSSFRWVRPIKSILCILDGEVVDFTVNGMPASNVTSGHRRMGAGPFTVSSFKEYRDTLEGEGHVKICACERKALILKDAKSVCEKAGLALVEDEGLLSEVAGLAEWPTVILGDMDPSFLELPGEVIRLSMRTHQKYFAVRDPKTGKLAPHFVVVANQLAPDGGKEIARGNSRVLSARLDDAKFFQSEDAKTKLMDNYDKLDGVIFHKKLGTIKDKSERVAALARELAPKVGADPDKAELAAKLAKCDLVTNMVVEFTSLQGQIGRLMYEQEGGDPDIAIAIEDHYKPQGPKDHVPTNPVAIAVALADKIETLFSFFAIAKETPTGSKDPFALRRTALGLLRIQIENNIIIWPRGMFETHATINCAELHYLSYADEIDQIEQFLRTRLEVLLKSNGHRMDTVEAVAAASSTHTSNSLPHTLWYTRSIELESFLATEDGANLLTGYKRAANILKAEAKKGELPSPVIHAGNTKEEAALFAAIGNATPKVETALKNENYDGAMTALAELREPIDAFFDGVIVNADVANERENRLGLLVEIRKLAKMIADFDKIEG